MSNVRKILIVDGDPVVRKTFEQALTSKGFAVNTAPSGEDALWQLGQGKYDAVFTEIQMRGMSGLEVAAEIHASQPGVPVVIITEEGSKAAQERSVAAGVAEFLQKPLTPEQLVDTARRVLHITESAGTLPPQASGAEIEPAQTVSALVLRLKNIVLFLFAPFVGLVYLLAFPVLLPATVVWKILLQPEETEPPHSAGPTNPGIVKCIAMLFATFFIGVFYAVFGPLIGIGCLIWFAFQAWGKVGAKAIGGSSQT